MSLAKFSDQLLKFLLRYLICMHAAVPLTGNTQVPAMSIMCNNKEDTDEQRMRRRRRRTYTQVLPKSHKFATIVELSMVPGCIAMGFICM